MRRTCKRNASFDTDGSSGKRSKDRSFIGFSPSGSKSPDTPSLSEVAGELKALSIYDVLFLGRTDGSTTDVIRGAIVSILPFTLFLISTTDLGRSAISSHRSQTFRRLSLILTTSRLKRSLTLSLFLVLRLP